MLRLSVWLAGLCVIAFATITTREQPANLEPDCSGLDAAQPLSAQELLVGYFAVGSTLGSSEPTVLL